MGIRSIQVPKTITSILSDTRREVTTPGMALMRGTRTMLP